MKLNFLRLSLLSVLVMLCGVGATAQTIKTVNGTTTTWDLTAITESMCATLGTGWESKSNNTYYQTTAKVETSPTFAEGLKFIDTNSTGGKSRVYTNGTGYYFGGNAAAMAVAVTAGQTLVVTTTGGGGVTSQTNGVTFTITGTGPYTSTATIPDGVTEVKFARAVASATYCTSIVTKTESKKAANLVVTSSSSLVLAQGSTSQVTYTTNSDAAVTFRSNSATVATVSDAGLITAVGSGATTIELSQAETDTYQAGVAQVSVAVPYAHTAAEEYVIGKATYGFSDASNNYYFQNGFSMSNSGSKAYGYGSLEGSIKCSANTKYTINIPEGVTIYSATVTGRSNYATTDNQAAASWGVLFGEDFSSVNLPYSDQDPVTKTVYFTEGATGSLEFTPKGNQVQFIITLSTSSRKASDLTLTSEASVNIAEVGGTSQITWTTSAAASSISFSSNKEGVATVDANGLITAVSQGTAIITLAQSGDATYRDDSKTIAVTVGEARTFTDFSINFLKSWASTSTITGGTKYYVTATSEGVPTFTANEQTEYLATFTGNYHGNQYGLRPGSVVTVPVDGPVKIFIGTSDYGGDFTITNSANDIVASGNAKGDKFSANPNNVTYVYYNGGATTLTITSQNGSYGYLPYIAVEAVDASDVPELYTITFMNGDATATTVKVYEGTAIGTLPAAPAVSANQQFVGWYSALDGTGVAATAATKPTESTTYYAIIKDITTSNGFIIVDNSGAEGVNGDNFKAALAYANKNADFNIFVPNGTYHLGQDALTTITRSNLSIIGESMEGVVIKSRPVKESINATATLLNTGSNNYFQDITLDCIAPWGGSAERGVCLQDKGNQTICKNVYLKGLQDSYYSNNNSGTYYFEDGKIEGSVDYACGNGDVYFNGVTFYTVNKSTGASGGCIAAPNTKKSFGYIFNECTLDGMTNEDGKYRLGRPWADETIIRMLDTKMQILPNDAGWDEWSSNAADQHSAAQFAEYNSVDKDGNAVSLSNRKKSFKDKSTTPVTNNPIITDAEAANYRPAAIFAGDWKPYTIATQLEAPNATYDNGSVTWTPANNGATAYLIEKNGKFVAITSENSYAIEIDAAKDKLTIRAANSRGGFGEAKQVAGTATGIHAINAAIERGEQVIYNIAGQRVNKATRGLYIVNGKKIIVK